MSPPSRSVYRVLVPHGSRRDRFVWIATVTVKKLREGPGPWLRAVKKGLYQLLPVAVQQRILRWTGQDEFFRRSEVRHAAADGGVEQPGLVSVVLPVFNQADMVAAAIDTVLAQSYQPFELIVVDDGSTDGVHDVLRRYLDDPRVRVVTEPNQGLPKALSSGFEFATGEFFTWTSADNLMHPDQLERLVRFLRERPEVAMVYADYELIDARGQPLVGGEFRVMDRTDKQNLAAVRVSRSTHDLNRYEDNFIGGCFLYRGQIGRLLGDYNPELGLEDYDYWLRINRMFRIEHLGSDELLYRYRVHDNTLSARARELKIHERAKVLMAYERDRAAWLQAPLRVLATTTIAAALREHVRDPDTLVDFAGCAAGGVADAIPDAIPDDGRKTLVALGGRELGAWSPDRLPPHASIAAFFATPEEAYLAHDQLSHLPVAAFARDPDTAARLATFTRSVFHGAPDAASLALAARHGGNHTFFRKTRSGEALRRAVPMPLPAQSPLRVLLQVDVFLTGGLERVVEDLAVCLQRQGCEVGVLAIDAAASTMPTLPDVEIVRLDARSAEDYEQMLAQGRWHVVSAHASVFGAATAQAAGVPFVQTVHNSYVWFDREQVDAHRQADAFTSAYVCVSAQALGYADLRLQLDVQKLLVIENGVDPAPAAQPTAAELAALRTEFGFGQGDFVLVQVASLHPAKAHRVALHALAKLRKQHPHAKLLCLGSELNPMLLPTLRGDATAQGIADDVVFAGHRDDAAACYAMADAFVLPSYWEGCSLAVWEAIRAGLPMVLSDVGAAREQLRHGRGTLVPPPFASMFELDATNLDSITRGVDAAFVERTAAAMAKVLAATEASTATVPRPTRPATALPHVANRSTMAQRHLLLFRWLRQGGTVAAIRTAVAHAAEPDRGTDAAVR